MKLEIKGADALLTKLNKGVEYSDVKKVVKVNTAEMHKSAQRNAPVDTGFLKRSIEMDITDQVGKVIPTAHYAPYVEFGTRYQNSQPFIAPAYHKQKKKFINDLKRVME